MTENEENIIHRSSKRIFFEGQTLRVLNEVYEPAEDTFLLAENLQADTDDVILEIGSGCGIISVLSAQRASRVISIDINPHAVECTKLNAKDNGVSDKINIVQGDLFGPLKEDQIFSLVLFNAPYLPTNEDDLNNWIDYAWAGGKKGRELIDRFIISAPKYLKADGRILLVQSTLSDVQETQTRMRANGFETKIIGESKTDFETITLMEARLISSRHGQL